MDSGRRSCSWWISSAVVPSSSQWSGEDTGLPLNLLRPCTLTWLGTCLPVPLRPLPYSIADACTLDGLNTDQFPYSSTCSRSIRHLQDASGTDGKGEDPLLDFVPALLSL